MGVYGGRSPEFFCQVQPTSSGEEFIPYRGHELVSVLTQCACTADTRRCCRWPDGKKRVEFLDSVDPITVT